MQVELIPLGDHPAGAQIAVEWQVPTGATTLRVLLARCTSDCPDIFADADAVVGVSVEALQDNGEWAPAGAMAALGGTHVRRDGTEAAWSYLDPKGPGNALRVTLRTEHPVRTRVLVDWA